MKDDQAVDMCYSAPQVSDGILAYAQWAGLTYPVLQNTPYYTEQWAAKDAFWDNAKARSLYRANLRVLFNRCAARTPARNISANDAQQSCCHLLTLYRLQLAPDYRATAYAAWH